MPQQVTLYRILIASPSDVVNERKAIPEVIHSWNAVNSFKYGITLEPVMWETHATPKMGDRPQAIINKQLVENCDILIGAFWTRLGTHTGNSESGTVEEIEEFRKAGKPVLLYFSSIPVVLDSVDSDQYKRLLEFKEQCKGEGLVWTYESIGDLREQLQKHITSTINSIHIGTNIGDLQKEESEEKEKLSVIEMFKIQFESFLRRLESEWNSERDSEPMDTKEGKYILSKARSEILEFRAQIEQDEGSLLTSIIDEALKSIAAIQRHQVYLDGGRSFKAFWEKGNQIIDLLKKVPVEINNILSETTFRR